MLARRRRRWTFLSYLGPGMLMLGVAGLTVKHHPEALWLEVAKVGSIGLVALGVRRQIVFAVLVVISVLVDCLFMR